MMSQVDLSREAAHLSRFIFNFLRWKDVLFPRPLYPLVHPSVLVETYEHGESVLHYMKDRRRFSVPSLTLGPCSFKDALGMDNCFVFSFLVSFLSYRIA